MEDNPQQETVMDVTSIAKLSTTIAETGRNEEVAVTMLKKQQDMQKTNMTQILEGIQPPQNLPPHLGNKINTTA
jgi:glycerol-3-phosphate dehydrogenase